MILVVMILLGEKIIKRKKIKKIHLIIQYIKNCCTLRGTIVLEHM